MRKVERLVLLQAHKHQRRIKTSLNRKEFGGGHMTAHRLIVQDVGGSAETHLVLVTIMAPRCWLLITAAKAAHVCVCARLHYAKHA